MHRSTLLIASIATVCVSACSERSAPQPAAETEPTQPVLAPLTADPDALRAKLNAGGIPTEYAAHFEGNQLARIVERRDGASVPLDAEYTFKGARLLSYRGAKLSGSAPLDLHFDMQGVLQSGQGPDVSDEEIAAIRTRAQLLRSHALAQRATRNH